MSWEEDMNQANQERNNSSTSDFFKFVVGEQVMRIMTTPVKKESRFGYGICYPGASYCDPAVIEKEYQDKLEQYGKEFEEARKRGATKADLKQIKKPSRANIGLKWSVWAIVRTVKDEKGRVEQINEIKLVDLTHTISNELLALKMDKDMGTAFDGFPMPYDVKIIVKKKDTKGRAWTPKDVEYSLVAGQHRKEITQSELENLEKKTPVEQIIERMQEKQRAEDDGFEGNYDGENPTPGVDYPKDEINPDDIPF